MIQPFWLPALLPITPTEELFREVSVPALLPG